MANQPLVSIVTPSFNQAQFLEETILSVLNQNYPNIEYIIIDGGSTDGSIDIIRKYEDRLAYWVSEPDNGQADAINKGWKRATGEIWSYLNSDDILMPNTINITVNAFRSHPEAGIVYGNCLLIDMVGHELGRIENKLCDFHKLLRDGQGQYICQPASFYRGSLLQQVGLLDQTLHLTMDYDLLLRLARVSELVFIPQELAGFRLHTSAKTSLYAKRHWQESLSVRGRYGGRYLLKPRIQYLRYRLFQRMPRFAQILFRRWRNSANDQMYLRTAGNQK